jgi:hypothetical protein
MPRTRRTPGTERFRDEQRRGGPRMHGRQWHDHDEPSNPTPGDLEMEELDARPQAESAPEQTGMGRGRLARKTKGVARQLEPSPRAKGTHHPVGGGLKTRRGQKGSSRM